MISEHIFLVAHTENDNTKGLVFNILLTAIENKKATYIAEGSMATTLLPLFEKIVFILKKIQPSWKLLDDYQLKLTGDYAQYTVKQYDSAGLGLAIGLYNIARKINHSSFAEGITGTGMIRFDGSVDEVRGISSKKEASLDIPNFKKLLSKHDITHLSQLHHALKAYH